MNQPLLEILQQAYRDLALFPLVEPEQIERFRVDYGQEVLVRLKQEVAASPKNGKFVFAGHRGCGKSTLLKRFSVEMQPNHSVVFFSIADLIELSDVNHVTILYAIALKLLSMASKQKIPVSADLQADLVGWATTVEKQVTEQGAKAEAGFSLDEILPLLTVKMQQERSFREQVERTFERRITDLVNKLDRVAAAIQITKKKPVLVVIDDLDKLDLPVVEDIYRNNIKSIFSPSFRIVFTIPVSSVQEPVVMGALNSEGIVRLHLFPVAKFYHQSDYGNPQAIPIAPTVERFLEVLRKRLPETLIDVTTAQNIVLASGGVIRELVRLARECCTVGMVQLELEPEKSFLVLDANILERAIVNLRNDFARQLKKDDYQILAQIHENNLPPDEDQTNAFVKLLHGLMVLEYENADVWYGVHPIVVDLLRRKRVIQ